MACVIEAGRPTGNRPTNIPENIYYLFRHNLMRKRDNRSKVISEKNV